jgi:hypothetical protein
VACIQFFPLLHHLFLCPCLPAARDELAWSVAEEEEGEGLLLLLLLLLLVVVEGGEKRGLQCGAGREARAEERLFVCICVCVCACVRGCVDVWFGKGGVSK